MKTYSKVSKEFANILKTLYEPNKGLIGDSLTFDKIVESNESRLDFINKMMKLYEEEQLAPEQIDFLNDNMDFIYDFLNGNYNNGIPVPEEFYDEEKMIIPSQKDIKNMINLIRLNVNMYELLYDNKNYYIILPNHSFNMNMARIIRVEYKNLAHLLGLTDSQQSEKKEANAFLKYFLKHNKENSKEGTDSEKLLDWIMSEDGEEELLAINQRLLDFVKEDKKKNATAYDKDGNIKNANGFKKRFRNLYPDAEEYPFIDYSKIMKKCINNLNFFNMTNISQMILDYNSKISIDKNGQEQKDDKSERDLYLIGTNSESILSSIKKYTDLKGKLYQIIKNGNKDYKSAIEKIFTEFPELIKGKNKEAVSSDLETLINIHHTEPFVGRHHIQVNDKNTTRIKDAINKDLGSKFSRDIHLIGLGTDIDEEQELGLNEHSVNRSHCDTSQSVKVNELVEKYFKRGRPFFLDKIYSQDHEIYRLSNPIEEINFNKQKGLLKRVRNLEQKLKEFNDSYAINKNKGPNKTK